MYILNNLEGLLRASGKSVKERDQEGDIIMIKGTRPAHNLVKVHGYLHIDEDSENNGGNMPNLSYVVLDPNDKKQKNVQNPGKQQKNVENFGVKQQKNGLGFKHRVSPERRQSEVSDQRKREHNRQQIKEAAKQDQASKVLEQNLTSSYEDISLINHSNESNQSVLIDVTEDLYQTPPRIQEKVSPPKSYQKNVSSFKSSCFVRRLRWLLGRKGYFLLPLINVHYYFGYGRPVVPFYHNHRKKLKNSNIFP